MPRRSRSKSRSRRGGYGEVVQPSYGTTGTQSLGQSAMTGVQNVGQTAQSALNVAEEKTKQGLAVASQGASSLWSSLKSAFAPAPAPMQPYAPSASAPTYAQAPVQGGKRSKRRGGFPGIFKMFSQKRSMGRGQMRSMGRTRGRGQSRSRRGGVAVPYSMDIWKEPGVYPGAVGGSKRRRHRRGGAVTPYSKDIWTQNGAFPAAVGGSKKRRNRKH